MKKEEILKKINSDETMRYIFEEAVAAYMMYMEKGDSIETDFCGINIGLEMALRHMLGFDILDIDSDTELHEAVKMQCQLQYYF